MVGASSVISPSLCEGDNFHMDKQKTMTTAEAGKLGGDKIMRERGAGFFSRIGRMQGKTNNPGNFANRSKKEVREAGRRGGEAKGLKSPGAEVS